MYRIMSNKICPIFAFGHFTRILIPISKLLQSPIKVICAIILDTSFEKNWYFLIHIGIYFCCLPCASKWAASSNAWSCFLPCAFSRLSSNIIPIWHEGSGEMKAYSVFFANRAYVAYCGFLSSVSFCLFIRGLNSETMYRNIK